MNAPTDPVRDAFLKVERALRPLSDPERRRVLTAMMTLLDMGDPAVGATP